LDVAKEVLPNLGPDWGLCLTTPTDKETFPHVLTALRVKPGNKVNPIDRALVNAVQALASLGVLRYNLTVPPGQQLHIKSVVEDKVEIKSLHSPGGLPGGIQPAFALKDGYLLLATSLEPIRRFAPAAGGAPPSSAEMPLLRMSLQEWAKYLKARREV